MKKGNNQTGAKAHQEDMQKYLQRLLELRASLSKNIAYLEDNALKPITSDGFSVSKSAGGDHNAELGTDSNDQDRMLRMAESSEEELQEIDAALLRLQNNTYGQCECCGKPISRTRLRALPYARLCLKCREEHERSQVSMS